AFAPGMPARHENAECQLCLRCLPGCQKDDRVSFTMRSRAPQAPLDLGRRQVITAMAAGAALAPMVRLGSLARQPDEFLIRPPGAQKEGEFLSRCIRCGQCLKVCLTNGLQPVFWEGNNIFYILSQGSDKGIFSCAWPLNGLCQSPLQP